MAVEPGSCLIYQRHPLSRRDTRPAKTYDLNSLRFLFLFIIPSSKILIGIGIRHGSIVIRLDPRLVRGRGFFHDEVLLLGRLGGLFLDSCCFGHLGSYTAYWNGVVKVGRSSMPGGRIVLPANQGCGFFVASRLFFEMIRCDAVIGSALITQSFRGLESPLILAEPPGCPWNPTIEVNLQTTCALDMEPTAFNKQPESLSEYRSRHSYRFQKNKIR